MTPMVKRILIICAAVWVAEVVSVAWIGTGALVENLALTPILVFPGLAIWQPLTYMWLHSPSDFFHILLNGLFLWMFGGNLELAWGSKWFFRFYLITGVGAGIVVLIVGLLFSPAIPVLGASGAIYGLVVAWGILYPNKVIYFFGLFPIKGKHFVLIPIGYALIEFLMRAQGVSHAAHLGGMAVGALLVTGFWRPDKARRQFRYWWLRRKLRVLDGDKEDKPKDEPPEGGYWH